MNKLPTGAGFLNHFLNEGYETDVVTTLYGPSGSGKTNLCLLAAIEAAQGGKKVIFIDTEGGIAVERIKQITLQYKEILERIIFFNPYNFEQQKDVFTELPTLINHSIGLIIVDSISMLYRLELGKNEDIYGTNSALGKQLGCLVEIARSKKVPVLVTNQVYTDFDHRDQVKMVGGDLLKYGSKCLLELQKNADCRSLILRKHRSLPEGKEIKFHIVGKGIEETN